MVRRWQNKIVCADSDVQKFEHLVQLYRSYLAGETSNIKKLELKIQMIYDKMSLSSKKKFTKIMIDEGLLGEQELKVIKIYGGVIWQIIK